MLPEWLTFYPSISSPYVYFPVAIAVVVLVMALMRKPYLFVPFMMWACPIPKLFSIGVTAENYETIAGGTIISTARPGGSAGELVFLAGMIVLLLRLVQGRTGRSGSIARPLLAWITVVLLSSAVAVVVSDIYRPTYVLYAIRYCATMACYFIAKHLTSGVQNKVLLKRASRWLFVCGNTYVVLAFIYYLLWGWTKSPWVDEVASGSNGVWRNYLFFFDYAYDYGMFGACVCVLDIAIYAAVRARALRVVALLGAALAAVTVVLSGERGCLLILASALFGMGWMILTNRSAIRLSRQVAAVTAVIVLIAVTYSLLFPPESITGKLANTAKDIGEGAGELAIQAGVDPSIAYWIGRLNMGDLAYRVALMTGSLTYFLQHPVGVGFGAELPATGWFAHHDVARLAVEEGVLGLVAFGFLVVKLARFCSTRTARQGQSPASDAARTVAVALVFGMLAGMTCAVTTIFSLKFGLLFWTLLGVTDPRALSIQRKSPAPDSPRTPRLCPRSAQVQGSPAR
ncbi:MAG TPA: hypothetical protein VLY04_22440 [Bryobacteraceae bacterium]|nr:hypothetical protein [Bryobacteraceae bacterium]